MSQLYKSIAIASVIIISVSMGIAFGNENLNYLPLSNSERRMFPMSYIGLIDTDSVVKKISTGTLEADIDITENRNVIFRGRDKIGKAWSVHIGTPTCRGLSIYVADLDKNGLQDIVLYTGTCGNGLAPPAHIMTIMFDSQKRPVFFEADGYSDYDEKGISDIIASDKSGKAELLYMNFDDGYWITNLYEAEDARWQRIRGKHGKRTYPLFTSFTHRPNKKPVTPKQGRHPFAPDFSNKSYALQARIISCSLENRSDYEAIPLMMETLEGDRFACQLAGRHIDSAVVADNKEGRRIVSLSANEQAVKSLLDEIIAHKYSVNLYGQGRFGYCSPTIVWVSANEN